MREIEPPAEPARAPADGRRFWASRRRGRRQTWVLGGGGGRGAAQVGALLAMFEYGLEPPDRLIGVSVGALNACTVAAFPSLAGAEMLRELWLSRQARDVFRTHPLNVVWSRITGGTVSALPASNVTRVIERALQLSGITDFEDLKIPLQVLATDIGAGLPHVFEQGPLLPALQASTAIPGIFPTVSIDGHAYLDGGIVDNMPINLAIEEGSREVVGIALMAGGELDHQPMGWAQLMGRTLQLSLHHRMLSDFERLREAARVVLICPVLPPGEGMDMRRDRVASIIESVRESTLRLLREQGRRLFARSAIHYVD
jgi:NTE family protein